MTIDVDNTSYPRISFTDQVNRYDSQRDWGYSILDKINTKIQMHRMNKGNHPDVCIISRKTQYYIELASYISNMYLDKGIDGHYRLMGVRVLFCDNLVEGEILIY